MSRPSPDSGPPFLALPSLSPASLAAEQRALPQLRQLRLWNFGVYRGSHNPGCTPSEGGLRLEGLLDLAPSLTLLELGRCGVAACAPDTLERLIGLQVCVWGEDGQGRAEERGGGRKQEW